MKPNYWYCAGVHPPLPGQLDNGMWKNFNPLPFLKNNTIHLPILKGGIWYEWFAAGETSCNNDSIKYFSDSVDNSIMDSEGNACGIISIPIIESTFDNYHIHVLHDI